jgi:hypothetical protein
MKEADMFRVMKWMLFWGSAAVLVPLMLIFFGFVPTAIMLGCAYFAYRMLTRG